MADNTQDAMAAAGFTQAPQGGTVQPPTGFVQAPTFVQAPQPIPQPVQIIQQIPQSQPVQFVQAPINTTGTNISPTTVVSGNENTVNNFSSIIQDNAGGISSMRVLMLLWGVGVFLMWAGAWIVLMVHGVYTPPSIPAEIITVLLGITGTKCVQRFGEK